MDLTIVILGDGTWIFIFSFVRLEVKTFHLGSSPDALNVCGRHLKESLEDFLTTHFGSLKGVHNNDAPCLTGGVVASTDRRKKIRIIARGLGVAVPFGQRGEAHVLVTRSSWSGNPPGGALRDLAGRGTGLRCRPCRPRSANSNTRSQPITTPTLTPTEKKPTMSGRRKRNSASVLVAICGHMWRVRRIRRKPKSRHVERLLIWEGTRGQILWQVVIGGRLFSDERKRSIIMDRQNWFNGLAKDACENDSRRTRWVGGCCLSGRCSSGLEETSNIQE